MRGINIFLVTFTSMLILYAIYSNVSVSSLPSFAVKSPEIKEAYLFAKDNPEALNGIKCHCGCDSIHKDLLNCYIQDKGDFEIHASYCAICINDALETKQLSGEGKTKEEINSILDNQYKEVRQK